MKKFHLNISVIELNASVAFYTALFGAAPTTLKPDYAKWMLDDPALNFALSSKTGATGIEHVGLQAENEQELQEIYQRMDKAKGLKKEEGKTICCYAKSEKSWITDPQGVEWEAFYTYGTSTVYREPGEASCCSKS